jgi:DNA modification methylase
VTALFEKWIGERTPIFLGTNHMSQELPFSSWYRFKEAFSPEIVHQAIAEHPTNVQLCVDPFSGSGTTALTSQFLGVASKSYEVNPFLADLGLAKLERYDLQAVRSAQSWLMDSIASQSLSDVEQPELWLPPTFVEPGKNGKWLFNKEVAGITFKLRHIISKLEDRSIERLFRVILGACLIENSNVVINGKGRRYRKNWQNREKGRNDLITSFQAKLEICLSDIENFGCKWKTPSTLENCDIRDPHLEIPPYDVSIFSPPYPNSFDYTDVYNVELWMLGYLKSRDDNTLLRKSTLTSHVQISKSFSSLATPPAALSETVRKIEDSRDKLWDRRIPRMLETYFFEMSQLLEKLFASKKAGGRVWIVVGNSQYVGVEVETAKILADIAQGHGFKVLQNRISRKMRNSPQQGGAPRLGEAILVLG